MKELILEAQKIFNAKDDCYAVRIIKQTHRSNNFANGVNEFKSSTMILNSSSYPALCDDLCEFEDNTTVFYVRGNIRKKDNTVIIVNKKMLNKIIIAVKEYNEYYKDKNNLDIDNISNNIITIK